MAEFDYDRPRRRAERMIKRYGTQGWIRRTAAAVGATGDPWNPAGEQPARQQDDHPIRFVFVDEALEDRPGSQIQDGNRRVLISTIGLTIAVTDDDQLVMRRPDGQKGSALEIVRVLPLAPDGTVVFWDAEVKG